MELGTAPAISGSESSFANTDPARLALGSPELSEYEWTIIFPFYNEERFVVECVRSAASQSVGFDLILVDNGSTDASIVLAESECLRLGIRHRLLKVPVRGKVHALERGLRDVRTPFIATFDADTTYPTHYLAAASRLLRRSGCVGAQAYYVEPIWGRWRRKAAAFRFLTVTGLLPHQSHTGGAGQVFRADALRQSGGFDASRWDLVLEDHEVMHRLCQVGKLRADSNFWCSPSRREKDVPASRWSLFERLRYHLTGPRHQARFFYEFLAPRLRARRASGGPPG